MLLNFFNSCNDFSFDILHDDDIILKSYTSISGYKTPEQQVEEYSSIDDLIDILKKKDSKYKKWFLKIKNIKCAVNCEYVKSFKKKICNADEVAFFPPVTGG